MCALAERRRGEQAAARQTATEKELTVARLNLLHAQVEPHFLYNTLASAQYLTRTDPARADEMLGHLIAYLRHSLPRTGEALSTLADELERSRAYLEILRVRMGDRWLGPGEPVLVIAEIGLNHNGDLDLALELIDLAAASGADAVKFQKREVDLCFTRAALDAPYPGRNSFGADH